jgi:quercetin dioxygenase-like cupin family protein
MSPAAIEVMHSQPNSMSKPEPGLLRQVMSYSPRMMLVRHTMKKGWVGARHSHPHEQMVYIISGHLTFQHPGGVFDAKAGDSFLVPGGVEHQASAREDSEVLDVFTPYREDYAPPR